MTVKWVPSPNKDLADLGAEVLVYDPEAEEDKHPSDAQEFWKSMDGDDLALRPHLFQRKNEGEWCAFCGDHEGHWRHAETWIACRGGVELARRIQAKVRKERDIQGAEQDQ